MPPGLVAGIGIVPPLEGEVVVIDGEGGGKGEKDKKMKEVVVIDGEEGDGEGGGKGGKDKKMKEVVVID